MSFVKWLDNHSFEIKTLDSNIANSLYSSEIYKNGRFDTLSALSLNVYEAIMK